MKQHFDSNGPLAPQTVRILVKDKKSKGIKNIGTLVVLKPQDYKTLTPVSTVYVGATFCGPEDTFSKSEGRKGALARAGRALGDCLEPADLGGPMSLAESEDLVRSVLQCRFTPSRPGDVRRHLTTLLGNGN